MSYILDALQRAEAERERGAVPGLHTQPLAAPAQHRNTWPRSALWAPLLVACSVAALLAGWWFGRSGATPPATAPAPEARVSTPPAVASPAPHAVTATVAAVASPMASALAPPAPAPLKVASTPAQPPAAGTSVPVPWLAELPEETRRQIATMAITGAVYSDNPAQRLLLVNGQVLPQGSPVVADVTLEEIREHHSVFNFRGSRFRLSH